MHNIEQRIEWIRDKVRNAGAKGITIGFSGGKDSAVVLGLVVRAVGKENVIAVTMPCNAIGGREQSKSVKDAQLVADGLGVKLHTIDIGDAYRTILASTSVLGEMNDMAKANIMPRIRMTTLYTIGQTHNNLVVGTDNKSEMVMGYFTKYGDGGYDINPIGDLTVKEVIELGDYLGLPYEIVHKAPSAGLWEGQTDEDEMGVSYSHIDEYVKTGKTEDKAQIIIEKTYNKTKHKREMPYIFPN